MEADDSHMTVKDLKRFEKEKQFIGGKISDLEAQLETARIKIDEFSAMQSVHTQELIDSRQQLAEADNRLKLNKEVGARFERLAKERETRIDELEDDMRKANETIEQCKERIEALESQLDQVGSGRQDLIDQTALVNMLRKQLAQAISAASREQNDVQNALQTTAMMLQEMRIEYEKFTETSRAEFHDHLDAKDGELEAVKQRLDRGNQVHIENAKHMLLEQKELVDAVKSQFDEYRRTAEHIFMTEAKKMQGKLSAQSLKHELVMQYTIRAKDLHFRRMVASKDAKVMNLIEGTDLQAFLVKHEIELDHLRRQHERDLEIVKEEVEESQKKQLQQLQTTITVQELDLDKANQNVKHLETKLGETLEQIKLSKLETLSKDAAHAAQMNEMQDQVRVSQQIVDNLTRGHETLRHRIVRLKLKLNGAGRDDLGSLLQRLTTESQRLSQMFENLSAKHEAATQLCDKLAAERDRHRDITVALKQDLLERRKNMDSLTNAFESFLRSHLSHPSGVNSHRKRISIKQQSHLVSDDRKQASATSPESNDDAQPATMREDEHERILERLRSLAHRIPLLAATPAGDGRSTLVDTQTMTRSTPLANSVGRALDTTRPLHRYREPYQLKTMTEDQILVRQNTIDDIQLGLNLISQFKALTRAYRDRDLDPSLIQPVARRQCRPSWEPLQADSDALPIDPGQDALHLKSILSERALYKTDPDPDLGGDLYQKRNHQPDASMSTADVAPSPFSSHFSQLEFDQTPISRHRRKASTTMALHGYIVAEFQRCTEAIRNWTNESGETGPEVAIASPI